MPPEPRHIGDVLRERNIELATNDPVVRGGFTQVPNFILKNGERSLAAKVTYSMFCITHLHNHSCFPGQQRLAADMCMSESRVSASRSWRERLNCTLFRPDTGLSRRA